MVNSSLQTPPSQEEVKIVAVDLQAMAPIPGVIQIQGDITKVWRKMYHEGRDLSWL